MTFDMSLRLLSSVFFKTVPRTATGHQRISVAAVQCSQQSARTSATNQKYTWFPNDRLVPISQPVPYMASSCLLFLLYSQGSPYPRWPLSSSCHSCAQFLLLHVSGTIYYIRENRLPVSKGESSPMPVPNKRKKSKTIIQKRKSNVFI